MCVRQSAGTDFLSKERSGRLSTCTDSLRKERRNEAFNRHRLSMQKGGGHKKRGGQQAHTFRLYKCTFNITALIVCELSVLIVYELSVNTELRSDA